jgi:hypothetical protein
MRKCLWLPLLFFYQLLHSQNIGIGTTSPQTTLDIKGNQRIGGLNKFIQYDSLSGKITWTNSNLFVPNSQYLMQHSASAEGLFYGNAQLEYRNQFGNPIFFTNWSSGNGYFSGNLGIGVTIPRAKLHVSTSGFVVNPFPYGPLVVEGGNNSYINLLTPDNSESGLLFGNASDAASGGIVYNNPGNPNGLEFRTNGNFPRMTLTSGGNLGIGTFPSEKLEVAGNIKANSFKYTSPKTYYYNIPGPAIHSEDDRDTVLYSLGAGSVLMIRVRPGGRMIAPIQLPQNAVMQSMTVYLTDNSNQYEMGVMLCRKTIISNFFPENLAYVASTGTGGALTSYSTSASFPPYNVIDNSLYTYYLSINSNIGLNFGSGLWDGSIELRAIVIAYTLAEP